MMDVKGVGVSSEGAKGDGVSGDGVSCDGVSSDGVKGDGVNGDDGPRSFQSGLSAKNPNPNYGIVIEIPIN